MWEKLDFKQQGKDMFGHQRALEKSSGLLGQNHDNECCRWGNKQRGKITFKSVYENVVCLCCDLQESESAFRLSKAIHWALTLQLHGRS